MLAVMSILSIVRADLRGSTTRQKAVAKACKIPWSTLRKIVDEHTNDPRMSTLEKLRKYYYGRP